jgi:hypothetical protein
VENRLLRVEVWDRQLTGDVEVGVGQINLEKILKTGGGECRFSFIQSLLSSSTIMAFQEEG